jgi:hypothetical protein
VTQLPLRHHRRGPGSHQQAGVRVLEGVHPATQNPQPVQDRPEPPPWHLASARAHILVLMVKLVPRDRLDAARPLPGRTVGARVQL